MKKYGKMTEEELFESHFDASHEIADIMRHIIDMKRKVVKLSKDLDQIDLEIESREAQFLKTQNKLN